MDANEFWCRAFLVAMQGNYISPEGPALTHDKYADYCAKAADAHLAVAQRRGMVTGEREPAPDVATLRGKVIMVDDATTPDAASQANVRRVIEQRMADRHIGPIVSTGVQAPELERVEFTAERGDHGLWNLSGLELGAGLTVASGATVSKLSSGATIRIKWGESMPPQPIEVWIERPAKGGA